jgi:hypothetical protein
MFQCCQQGQAAEQPSLHGFVRGGCCYCEPGEIASQYDDSQWQIEKRHRHLAHPFAGAVIETVLAVFRFAMKAAAIPCPDLR